MLHWKVASRGSGFFLKKYFDTCHQMFSIQSHSCFVAVFFVFVAFITNIFIQSELFIDTLGFVALCMEALLLLPQLLRNFKRKSTDGLSCKMVIMMLCGDLFKTCYYLARNVPSQFWICSSLQVRRDLWKTNPVMLRNHIFFFGNVFK